MARLLTEPLQLEGKREDFQSRGTVTLKVQERHRRKWAAPRIMTDVVPSPTSSSCVLLISIMDLAAGCWTWICTMGGTGVRSTTATRQHCHSYLSQNGVPIIGHDDASHRIHQHLHAATQTLQLHTLQGHPIHSAP